MALRAVNGLEALRRREPLMGVNFRRSEVVIFCPQTDRFNFVVQVIVKIDD